MERVAQRARGSKRSEMRRDERTRFFWFLCFLVFLCVRVFLFFWCLYFPVFFFLVYQFSYFLVFIVKIFNKTDHASSLRWSTLSDQNDGKKDMNPLSATGSEGKQQGSESWITGGIIRTESSILGRAGYTCYMLARQIEVRLSLTLNRIAFRFLILGPNEAEGLGTLSEMGPTQIQR